jgi:hypothetical protein
MSRFHTRQMAAALQRLVLLLTAASMNDRYLGSRSSGRR